MSDPSGQKQEAPLTRDEAINGIHAAAKAFAAACTVAVTAGVSIAEVMTLASQALVMPIGGADEHE